MHKSRNYRISTTTSQVSRGKLGEGASEIIPVGICKQGRFWITPIILALKNVENYGFWNCDRSGTT